MVHHHQKNIYICHTLYHVLISLVYSFLEAAPTKIVLTTRVSNAENIGTRIQKRCPLIEIEVVDDEQFRRDGWFYSEETHQRFRTYVGKGNVCIFNDSTQLGYYLHRNRMAYTLLEDGLNCLQHPLSAERLSLKQKIKYVLFNIPLAHGYSRYCKRIVVNEIARIPKDRRKRKLVEQSKRDMFAQLSQEDRETLLNIFEVEALSVKEPAVLMLTQPAGEGIPIEPGRSDSWGHLIEQYIAEGYHVYLKVHPRDTVDYSRYTVTIVSKNIPAELLDFAVDYPFAIGITYFSTALEMMSCVQEKIYLYWDK